MGRLDPFSDLTGKMSQSELNAQDISNIIEEINKIQDTQTGHIQQTNLATIINDGTTNRILNGYQSVLDQWGLFVSKPGIDVTKATADQLIFNSNQDIFKIALSDTATLSYDGNVNTFLTIPHGLLTIPIVSAYVQLPNDANFSPMNGQFVPMPVYMNRVGLPVLQCVQSADATNIYLRVHDIYSSGGSPEIYNFRYYIQQETAN